MSPEFICNSGTAEMGVGQSWFHFAVIVQFILSEFKINPKEFNVTILLSGPVTTGGLLSVVQSLSFEAVYL